MKTKDLFQTKKIVMSAEVFPPKKSGTMEGVIRALKGIKELSPDFVSVTFSAGASGGGAGTMSDVASVAQDAFDLNTVAHLTSVNMDKAAVSEVLESLKKKGIENVLALRGDINENSRFFDFRYASDLVSFIKTEYPDMNVLGGCYPEGHPETKSLDEDVEHLAFKVKCGVDHLVTQLFFDNSKFYVFRDKLAAKGVAAPLSCGIMPLTNANQMQRMFSLSGASAPDSLTKLLGRYEGDPEGLFAAGIEYANRQIADLVSNGVRGIHVYTMNNPRVAGAIFRAFEDVRNA